MVQSDTVPASRTLNVQKGKTYRAALAVDVNVSESDAICVYFEKRRKTTDHTDHTDKGNFKQKVCEVCG
jgi:hypothetical protein